MPGRNLHVAQVDAGVKHRGHEGVPQHVRVHPRQADTSDGREVPKSAGSSVSVHPRPAPVQEERPGRTLSRSTVNSAADGGRQRDKDDLAPLAPNPQNPVAVFLTKVVDVRADRLKDPEAEQAQQAHTSAKSKLFVDSLAAVSMASNCKCVRPSVGDSGGTLGRRTSSAGECSRTPSITQVR